MTELTITRGGSAGTSIILREDRTYTIGSAADASIRVGGSDVAARHVVIKALKGGGFGIKGLAGPFRHNGRSVEAARLSPGDTLEIGQTELRVGRASAGDTVEAQKIGGFRLAGILGKGGMGTVYRAEQVSLDREVALKVLSTDLTRDPEFVQRFVAEARAAAQLHHPNVVQVYDVDHEGDTYFYSMELMHQGSLEQRLRRDGKVAVDDAVSIVHDAAKGLAYAESLGIVHRDIKPDNLMVDRHGHVKLADLGLAHKEGDADGRLVGTPHFMAPEQIQRKAIDNRTDLYALGCTFYRLVTGTTPAKGETVKQILISQIKEDPQPAHKVNSDVPADVGGIIDKLLEKDPERRYQSAAELIADLEAVQTPPSRKGLVIAGLAVAALAAGGAIWWAVTQEPETRFVTQTDPDAERIRQERERLAAAKRESDATNALLQVRLNNLDGLEHADALEAMAKQYPGTEAAREATAEAVRVRDEARRAAAATAARQAALEQAERELRDAFQAALTAFDFTRADALLRAEQVREDLRDDAVIRTAVDKLREALQNAAAERLRGLSEAVDSAVAARDPAAVRAALAPLRAVVAEDGGWPSSALADRGPIVQLIAAGQQQADTIERELLQEAELAAWARARAATMEARGLRERILSLDLEGAAATAAQTGSSLGDSSAGARLAALAPAFGHAERYVAALQIAAADGSLQVPHGPDGSPAPVVGFVRNGAAAGFQVRVGPRVRPRDETVPLADARARPAEFFGAIDGASALERAAFLAVQGIGLYLREAPAYLARIDPADDASGTGDDGFRLAEAGVDDDILGQLAEAGTPWADALAGEVRALMLLGRALRAMSGGRNLSSAGLLDQLLGDHAGSWLVQSLL